jgi:diguanylate cyclase (GGDEF)-like protein
MERSGATHASRTTIGLLVAGPSLAVLAVARELPSADLAAAELAWVPAIMAVLLVAAATAAAGWWLVSGLRSGSLAELLGAGASAALAGGAIVAIAGSDVQIPLVGAASALLAAIIAERLGLVVPGRGVRMATAAAVVATAELVVLAELLPAITDLVEPVRTAIGVAAVILAAAAALIGFGRSMSAVAPVFLVGTVAAIDVTVARGPHLEHVIGLAALVTSQALAMATNLAWDDDPATDGPERMPAFARLLDDAVLRFDGRLGLRDWNPAAEKLLGLDASSAGARLEDLLGVSLAELPSQDGPVVVPGAVGGLRIDLQRNGDGLTALLRDSAATPETERLGRELRSTIEELLQTRRTVELQRQELERASTIDPLTGVTSRTTVLERLRLEMAQARRYQHPVAVVLLDIDDFSELNRRHGAAGGDAVLREVALRIRLRVREADALGRAGSDSFLAILPHTDEGGAATFADALQHRLGLRPIAVGAERVSVTISVGVAVMRPGEELDLDGLLGRVDEALASARSVGGNHIALDRLHGLARLEDRRSEGAPPTEEDRPA